MDAENTAVLPFEQRFRTCFGNMLVCKTPANAKLFAELNLPSFIRDWLIMRFSDQNGAIDQKKLTAYIKKTIPDKAQWNNMLVDMLYHNQTARFLAKVKIDFDMKKKAGVILAACVSGACPQGRGSGGLAGHREAPRRAAVIRRRVGHRQHSLRVRRRGQEQSL